MAVSKHVVGILLAVVMAVGYTMAQDRQPQQRDQARERQAGSTPSSQAGELDKSLAKWLIAKNKAEVDLASVGAEQAQNQQVQEFSRQMVQEHQQLIQQLEKIAGEGATRQERAFRAEPGQQQTQQQQQTQPQPQTQQQEREQRAFRGEPGQQAGQQDRQQLRTRQQGGDTLGQLCETIERVESRFAQTLKKGLEQKQGQEFDQAYIGLQVLCHMHMLDTLEVMKSQASGQLQQTIEQAQQSVEQHLQHAQKLDQQLDQQQGQQQGQQQDRQQG